MAEQSDKPEQPEKAEPPESAEQSDQPDPPHLFSLASLIPVSNVSILGEQFSQPFASCTSNLLMFQVWDLFELYRLDHEMYGYSPNLYLDYAQ